MARIVDVSEEHRNWASHTHTHTHTPSPSSHRRRDIEEGGGRGEEGEEEEEEAKAPPSPPPPFSSSDSTALLSPSLHPLQSPSNASSHQYHYIPSPSLPSHYTSHPTQHHTQKETATATATATEGDDGSVNRRRVNREPSLSTRKSSRNGLLSEEVKGNQGMSDEVEMSERRWKEGGERREQEPSHHSSFSHNSQMSRNPSRNHNELIEAVNAQAKEEEEEEEAKRRNRGEEVAIRVLKKRGESNAHIEDIVGEEGDEVEEEEEEESDQSVSRIRNSLLASSHVGGGGGGGRAPALQITIDSLKSSSSVTPPLTVVTGSLTGTGSDGLGTSTPHLLSIQPYRASIVSSSQNKRSSLFSPLTPNASSAAGTATSRGSFFGRRSSLFGPSNASPSSVSSFGSMHRRRRSSVSAAVGGVESGALAEKKHVEEWRAIMHTETQQLFWGGAAAAASHTPHASPSPTESKEEGEKNRGSTVFAEGGSGNTPVKESFNPLHSFMQSFHHSHQRHSSSSSTSSPLSSPPSSLSPHRLQYGYYFQPKVRSLLAEPEPQSSKALYYVHSSNSSSSSSSSFSAPSALPPPPSAKIYYVLPPSSRDLGVVRRGSLVASSIDQQQLSAMLKAAGKRRTSLQSEAKEEAKQEGEEEGEEEGDDDDEEEESEDDVPGVSSSSSPAVRGSNGVSDGGQHLCCICSTSDFVDPWQSSCGHIACSECWQTWLNENSSLTCPECGSSIDLERLQPVKLCSVCSSIPVEGWTAECGHCCCLSCWKTYLRENPSCPSCHLPIDKRQIPA